LGSDCDVFCVGFVAAFFAADDGYLPPVDSGDVVRSLAVSDRMEFDCYFWLEVVVAAPDSVLVWVVYRHFSASDDCAPGGGDDPQDDADDSEGSGHGEGEADSLAEALPERGGGFHGFS
jgi:hypothetical protein